MPYLFEQSLSLQEKMTGLNSVARAAYVHTHLGGMIKSKCSSVSRKVVVAAPGGNLSN